MLADMVSTNAEINMDRSEIWIKGTNDSKYCVRREVLGARTCGPFFKVPDALSVAHEQEGREEDLLLLGVKLAGRGPRNASPLGLLGLWHCQRVGAPSA